MTINEIQNDIIADFSMFEDWADKYEYIIDLGKSLPAMDEALKVEENKVHGCQSQVWLNPFKKDGKLYFEADSDAFITKGIIGLLVKVLSGHSPKEIFNADLYFIKETGLQAHLSPNRANGLANMVKKLKSYSLAFQSEEAG
ncbi:MAG: SufE family protein [Bacteroidetes bacterium]|nr:SufE family protein [Bacteroidota bacterium]